MKERIKKVTALLLTSVSLFGLSTTSFAYNYTVQPGSSYSDIGAAIGVNYPDLMAWNGASSDTLVTGQQIWIPDECLDPGFSAPYSTEYYEENYCNDYYYDTYYEEPTYYTESTYYEEPTYYTESTYYDEPTYEETYVSNDTYTSNDFYASGSASLSTAYYGNVAYNVGLACEYNNGVIIQPGCNYSAFDVLGDGGYSEGFKSSAGVGGDGSTITVPGSGICTVETMIWQAMRDAGMTEITRNPHNYGNSGGTCWYAPDPDDQAMFNAGTSNLVVGNPYDYPMKINASYIDGVISVTCEAVK